jgi:hypothetical protein
MNKFSKLNFEGQQIHVGMELMSFHPTTMT